MCALMIKCVLGHNTPDNKGGAREGSYLHGNILAASDDRVRTTNRYGLLCIGCVVHSEVRGEPVRDKGVVEVNEPLRNRHCEGGYQG